MNATSGTESRLNERLRDLILLPLELLVQHLCPHLHAIVRSYRRYSRAERATLLLGPNDPVGRPYSTSNCVISSKFEGTAALVWRSLVIVRGR
jgi:hypothetical protein